MDGNRSLDNISKNTNSIIDLLQNNLRSLDDEFFEIKHNFITDLMN